MDKALEPVLSDLLHMLRKSMMNESVLNQIFNAIFYRAGASLFNVFMSQPSLFECNTGLQIRFNISQLSEWSRRQRLDLTPYFRHVIQASQLLQTPKSSLDLHLSTLSEACNGLNSAQLKHLLSNYKPDKGEGPVPVDLISCIMAMAKVKADRSDIEDERAGCAVQIERNATHLLPFRLSGDFHMNHGLVIK